jgi:hypothetical protein
VQACGVPVALSLTSGRPMEELHAAAAAAAAATPLQLPEEGSNSSLGRLVRAVRQQKDSREAVTTALVTVLHVPARPHLAFPSGRRGAKPAAAAEGVRAAVPAAAAPAAPAAVTAPAALAGAAKEVRVEGSNGGVGGGSADGTIAEQLAEALEAFPTVKSLLEEFK